MSSKQKLRWSSRFPTEEGWYLLRPMSDHIDRDFGITYINLIPETDEDGEPVGTTEILITDHGVCDTITESEWTERKFERIGPIDD